MSIALAELIRYLIYATGAERRAAALPKPADGYAVVKNLRAAADAGQPLCTALADWAEGLAYGSNLRQVREAFDEAEFPAAGERARAAGQALRHAYMYAAELSGCLAQALDALAPLYYEH